MKRLTLALVIALAGILACVRTVEPTTTPRGIVAVPLTGNYQDWWIEIERCSGKRYPYYAIRWYTVPGPFVLDGQNLLGLARPKERQIVVALTHVLDAGLIRHEMLHIIASPFYHDPNLFQRGPCAELVMCLYSCITDTIPPATR